MKGKVMTPPRRSGMKSMPSSAPNTSKQKTMLGKKGFKKAKKGM